MASHVLRMSEALAWARSGELRDAKSLVALLLAEQVRREE
jgi:hypothetical protein